MVTHCLAVWSQTQHPGSSYSSYLNGPLAMFPEGLRVSSETDSSHYAEPRVWRWLNMNSPSMWLDVMIKRATLAFPLASQVLIFFLRRTECRLKFSDFKYILNLLYDMNPPKTPPPRPCFSCSFSRHPQNSIRLTTSGPRPHTYISFFVRYFPCLIECYVGNSSRI